LDTWERWWFERPGEEVMRRAKESFSADRIVGEFEAVLCGTGEQMVAHAA
jgi:hypothetical protein